MGKISDWWDDTKETVSDTWENIKDGDVLGILKDFGKGVLGQVTFGLSHKTWVQTPDISGASAAARDRKVTVRNTVAPQEVVYGTVRKGGTVVYVESSGTHDEFLHLIIVLASHKCHRVDKIYFDDNPVAYGGTKTGSSQVITPYYTFDGITYVPLVARFVDGSQTEMDSFVLSDAPDSLTTAHALTGHAFLYLKLNYDPDFYPNGIPDISVEMQGHALIYEPVGETYGYSNNHALCTLDYLLADYGLGIPIEEIDIDSFDAGATYCLEETDTPPQWVAVETPGYVVLGPGDTYTYTLTLDDSEPRFAVDGVLRVAGRPLANLETLAQAGAAYVCFSQGKWRYIRAEYVAPTLTLDESDLISGVDFAPSSGKGSRFNIVKGQFINPLEKWELTDYPAIVVQDYIDNDLEELEQVIDQPLITSPYRAQRLGKIAMERSRYGLTVSVTAKLKALELNVGDRVNLSITALGWTPKVFMVMDMDINLAGGVRLALREDHASIYDWDYNEQTAVTPPPAVNLPDPRPDLPTALTASEELYATNPPGDFKTRIIVAWTAETVRQTWYDVQYKLSAASEWTWARAGFRGGQATIEDAAVGTYDFRVRSMNGIGQYSDWVSTTNIQILGKTAPPPDLESLFISGEFLAWTYPDAPVDLAGYAVRLHQGNRTTWDDATPMFVGLHTVSQVYIQPWLSGTMTFLVKAVDTSGNYSAGHLSLVWTSTGRADENVILTDNQAPGWTGTLTGGTVNVSDQVEADQVADFYNQTVGGSLFYSAYGAADFYGDKFEKVTYLFSFDVASGDAGSQMTVTADVTNALSYQIDYIPPSSTGDYVPFPGLIPFAEEGTYEFRLTIPEQFDVLTPTVDDIIVTLDVPDIVEGLEDVTISNTGTRLPITKTYRGISVVSLTLQTDGSGAVALKIDDKNHTSGPLVYAYNAAGTAVATTIDAIIRGY